MNETTADATTPSPMEMTFISQSSPYGGSRAQLCLDMVLAAAVFDQSVNYLFLGDGVYQLLIGQEGDRIARKTLSKGLQALELYGVGKVVVSAEDIAQRGLSTGDLCIPCEALSVTDIKAMISRSDAVFTL